MSETAERRDHWNRCRFVLGDPGGHYESYFQRANHPSRPLAFWIRYTIMSPRGRPQDALGELWAIFFDGERVRIAAAKQEFPISRCQFSDARLSARIADAEIREGQLAGAAASAGHELQWDLRYEGEAEPLLLLPRSLYQRGFPRAKALVGTPHALYRGTLVVDGEPVTVERWPGSQNHNWGSRHTDHYAWGQVAGFDQAPDAFLECGTSRIRLGPLWSPWLTLVVLRVEGREFALNSIRQALRARGRFDYFTWNFDSRAPEVRIRGKIHAPRSVFVGLRYADPPGGEKTCLNTKLAACELRVERKGREPLSLQTADRAAFEILTDAHDHGVPVVA